MLITPTTLRMRVPLNNITQIATTNVKPTDVSLPNESIYIQPNKLLHGGTMKKKSKSNRKKPKKKRKKTKRNRKRKKRQRKKSKSHRKRSRKHRKRSKRH